MNMSDTQTPKTLRNLYVIVEAESWRDCWGEVEVDPKKVVGFAANRDAAREITQQLNTAVGLPPRQGVSPRYRFYQLSQDEVIDSLYDHGNLQR